MLLFNGQPLQLYKSSQAHGPHALLALHKLVQSSALSHDAHHLEYKSRSRPVRCHHQYCALLCNSCYLL